MRFASWNDDMSVGIKSIDDQHKKLLDVINDLHEAIGLGRGQEILSPLFQELSEYISGHFSHEEELMRTHLYPDLDSHTRAHQGFTKRVRQVESASGEDPLRAIEEALTFLWDWLIKHDVIIDKKLGAFLMDRGVS